MFISPTKALGLSLVLAATMIFPTLAMAEPSTFDEVVAELEGKFQNDTSMSFDMLTDVSMSGMVVKMTGSMLALGAESKGNLVMDMMGTPMTMDFVIDANRTQWIAMTMGAGAPPQHMKLDLNKVEEMTADVGSMALMGSQQGAIQVLTSPSETWKDLGAMYDMTMKGSEELDGAPVYRLDGVMKPDMQKKMDPDGMMEAGGNLPKYVSFWVGSADGFPRKFTLSAVEGTAFTTGEFKNIQTGVDVEEGAFTYTAPEGAFVMDITPMLAQQLSTFKASGAN